MGKSFTVSESSRAPRRVDGSGESGCWGARFNITETITFCRGKIASLNSSEIESTSGVSAGPGKSSADEGSSGGLTAASSRGAAALAGPSKTAEIMLSRSGNSSFMRPAGNFTTEGSCGRLDRGDGLLEGSTTGGGWVFAGGRNFWKKAFIKDPPAPNGRDLAEEGNPFISSIGAEGRAFECKAAPLTPRRPSRF